jgi:hypothetical protein
VEDVGERDQDATERLVAGVLSVAGGELASRHRRDPV